MTFTEGILTFGAIINVCVIAVNLRWIVRVESRLATIETTCKERRVKQADCHTNQHRRQEDEISVERC